MEYTKGKWGRGGLGDEPFARSLLSIYQEDGRRIAEVSREGFMRLEEAEANAQLIATAPRMYEALVKVREDINWMLNNRKFLNPNVFDYLDEATEQAEGK